jgi:hypothetical protein
MTIARKLVLAAVLALGAFAGVAAPASAGCYVPSYYH